MADHVYVGYDPMLYKHGCELVRLAFIEEGGAIVACVYECSLGNQVNAEVLPEYVGKGLIDGFVESGLLREIFPDVDEEEPWLYGTIEETEQQCSDSYSRMPEHVADELVRNRGCQGFVALMDKLREGRALIPPISVPETIEKMRVRNEERGLPAGEDIDAFVRLEASTQARLVMYLDQVVERPHEKPDVSVDAAEVAEWFNVESGCTDATEGAIRAVFGLWGWPESEDGKLIFDMGEAEFHRWQARAQGSAYKLLTELIVSFGDEGPAGVAER